MSDEKQKMGLGDVVDSLIGFVTGLIQGVIRFIEGVEELAGELFAVLSGYTTLAVPALSAYSASKALGYVGLPAYMIAFNAFALGFSTISTLASGFKINDSIDNAKLKVSEKRGMGLSRGYLWTPLGLYAMYFAIMHIVILLGHFTGDLAEWTNPLKVQVAFIWMEIPAVAMLTVRRQHKIEKRELERKIAKKDETSASYVTYDWRLESARLSDQDFIYLYNGGKQAVLDKYPNMKPENAQRWWKNNIKPRALELIAGGYVSPAEGSKV
jgi:hypothetical protein